VKLGLWIAFLLTAVAPLRSDALTLSTARASQDFQGRLVVLDSGTRVRIGRSLNAGWWSVGHEGVIEGSNQRVAIKIWSPKWQEHQGRAPTYRKDARILTTLSAGHPAWVRSLGTGSVAGSGERVLVTELAEGVTLGKSPTPRGVGKAVRITTRILAAIGAGHKRGLGDHDLNLGNEIVKDERSASVRLFDAGGVREGVDARVIATDVKRAGMMLVNLLVPAPKRGRPIAEKLALIKDASLRAVAQQAVDGRFVTAEQLAAALRPYYWN
jgi:hypothetical protein